MAHTKIEIKTEDGTCPAYVFKPDGKGPWPGVLMFMDGIGIRPSQLEIAARIAAAGYYTLLPDVFYRMGAYEPIVPAKVFGDAEWRTTWFGKVMQIASVDNIMRDTKAFLAHFAAQPDVKGNAIGVTGYCMGGRLSVCAAGYFGAKIAACGSYHPGGLVTDTPDSPHKLAPQIKAKLFIGPSTDDLQGDDRKQLAQALTDAKVDFTIEQFHAKHGWVPTDMPVHDAAEAERHYKTLFELFARTLT